MIGARNAWRGQGMTEKSKGEYDDEYDEWDARDQGGTCNDAAAKPPRPRICR